MLGKYIHIRHMYLFIVFNKSNTIAFFYFLIIWLVKINNYIFKIIIF